MISRGAVTTRASGGPFPSYRTSVGSFGGSRASSRFTAVEPGGVQYDGVNQPPSIPGYRTGERSYGSHGTEPPSAMLPDHLW